MPHVLDPLDMYIKAMSKRTKKIIKQLEAKE